MGVSRFLKAEFVVHHSQVAGFLEEIQNEGFLHIDPEELERLKLLIEDEKNIELQDLKKQIIPEEDQIKNNLYNVEKVLLYSKKWEKPGSFMSSFADEKLILPKKEFYHLLNDFEHQKVITQLSNTLDSINKNNEEINKLSQKIEHLKPFEKIDFNITLLRDINDFVIRLIVINKNKYSSFVESIEQLKDQSLIESNASENLADKTNEYSIEIIDQYQNDLYLAIISEKELYKEIFSLTRKYGGEEVTIEEEEGIIKEKIEQYKSEIIELQAQNNDFEKDLQAQYHLYSKNLKIYFDYYSGVLDKLQTESSFSATESCVFFTGWFLKSDKNLMEKFKENYKEVDIAIKEPEPDEQPPIAFSNKKIIKPYEFLTKLYAPPKAGEIDPTPLFAPFFALFFAICTGDAGYGLVLFLVSLFMKRKMKGESGALFGILLQSGFLTIIVGLLTGSFFGVTLPFTKSFILFNPMEEPLKLFVIALLLGIVQIFYSYTIPFVLWLMAKNYKKAFGEYFSYMIILVAVVFLVMPLIDVAVPGPVIKIMSGLLVLGVVLIIAFAGNDQPKGDRVLTKVFGVYGITGIIGDILSYARLLALGLASSVIALVVNILAGLIVGEHPSIIKYLFAAAVLIFGHTFNLLIGALGGFVHTLRLQYVEFFKQFYEGGGKLFKPFARFSKYTVMKED